MSFPVDDKHLPNYIAMYVVNKISESLGAHLGHPDSTELSMPTRSEIQVRVGTSEGVRYFSIKVSARIS